MRLPVDLVLERRNHCDGLANFLQSDAWLASHEYRPLIYCK
jgi:hypothetical protein